MRSTVFVIERIDPCSYGREVVGVGTTLPKARELIDQDVAAQAVEEGENPDMFAAQHDIDGLQYWASRTVAVSNDGDPDSFKTYYEYRISEITPDT